MVVAPAYLAAAFLALASAPFVALVVALAGLLDLDGAFLVGALKGFAAAFCCLMGLGDLDEFGYAATGLD